MAHRLREFIDQAILCLRDGQYEEAAEFARQAVDIAPDSPDAHAVLGVALSKSDLPDEAADAFKKAIRLDPQNPKHHYNLAAHYYRYGWRDHALKYAAEAVQIQPDYTPAKELIRRVEQDRYQPPPFAAHPPPPSTPLPEPADKPAAPTEAPPIVRTFTTDQPKPQHSLRWVASLGAGWEALFWGVFILHGFPLFFATDEALSMNLEGAMTMLESHGAYFLAWLVWVAVWVIDMVDRRPSGAWVALSTTGILLSFPYCVLFLTPILASILFVAYGIVTRSDRGNAPPQTS